VMREDGSGYLNWSGDGIVEVGVLYPCSVC
jgi:hypothetical protein